MSNRLRNIILRILPVILSFITLIEITEAQNGSPLLLHYRRDSEAENRTLSICQDDNRMMMFASRRGIMTFDGQNWDFIKIPVIPYTMGFKPDIGAIFIGSDNNFGYLERDQKGIYGYFSLVSDTIDHGLIKNIFFTDTTVWFYSEKTATRYNLISGASDLILKAPEGNPFTGLFTMPENTFVNLYRDGLCKIENDALVPLSSGRILRNRTIIFSQPYDNNHVLLGLEGGKLVLFDGRKFYDYQVKDEGYLQQNFLSGGIVVSDSLYAFSTLDGGVLVIEKQSGNIRHTINYARGLPDDEVFAIGMDNNGGLWISHQYGLTRADLILPVADFTIYPGLKGNLISPVIHNNELFVATSEGIFYLAEEKHYERVEVMVKEMPAQPVQKHQEVAVAEEPQLQVAEEKQEQVVTETVKQRKGLLARIFGRKNISQKQEETQQQPVAEQQVAEMKEISELPQPEPKESYVKRTFSRLKSVGHVFKKVEGFDEKCRQMVSTPSGILASTNRGLIIISGHRAVPLVRDRYIHSINRRTDGNKYWISASDGYFCVSLDSGKWKVSEPDPDFRRQVYSAVAAGDSLLWLGLDGMVAKVFMTDLPIYVYYRIKDDFPGRYVVYYLNDTLYAFSGSGIRYFKPEENTFVKYEISSTYDEGNIRFVHNQAGYPWVFNGDDWVCLNRDLKIPVPVRSILKVIDEVQSIHADNSTLWITGGDNCIYRIQGNRVRSFLPDFHLFVKSISDGHGNLFGLSDIVFGSRESNIYFELVSPAYIKQNATQYQYIVENLMGDWSKWSSASTINLMLQPGEYTLKVRAKDIWGNISEPHSIPFTIKTPFTRTAIFFVLVSLVGLAIVIAIIRFRERHLQMEKRILEDKVKERTAEIEAQKEEITSSIEYAGKIQVAMLPSEEHFRKCFKEYFLIFKPRDIVSGDFYWIAENGDNIYFTVADCTGHGVPGAFMSTLGMSMLNEIINNYFNLTAGELLNTLRRKIIDSLHQTGKEGEATDGMDISFCILNRKKNMLQFSGAFNPLFVSDGNQLTEYKGDQMPIGIHVSRELPFTNINITVKKGDIIYMFSDGITDQFGGPEGKKYKKSGFKKLLSSVSGLPLQVQKEIIEKEYACWKGNVEQIDDITILGVKI